MVTIQLSIQSLYLELPGDGDVLVPDLLRPVVPLLDLLLQLRVVS